MYTAHYPDYAILRAMHVTQIVRAAASTWSSFGEPDPHNKLPTMRPEASIILGPQSGQSLKKTENKPKAPRLEKASPNVKDAKGAKSGIGLLKRASSLFDKRKPLAPTEKDDDEDEDDGPSYPSHYYSAWAQHYAGGFGSLSAEAIKPK